MKKGIIIEHTLVDNFDGADIHKRPEIVPNTCVNVIGHGVFYGIAYTKIEYENIVGYVDSKCIVEI